MTNDHSSAAVRLFVSTHQFPHHQQLDEPRRGESTKASNPISTNAGTVSSKRLEMSSSFSTRQPTNTSHRHSCWAWLNQIKRPADNLVSMMRQSAFRYRHPKDWILSIRMKIDRSQTVSLFPTDRPIRMAVITFYLANRNEASVKKEKQTIVRRNDSAHKRAER